MEFTFSNCRNAVGTYKFVHRRSVGNDNFRANGERLVKTMPPSFCLRKMQMESARVLQFSEHRVGYFGEAADAVIFHASQRALRYDVEWRFDSLSVVRPMPSVDAFLSPAYLRIARKH